MFFERTYFSVWGFHGLLLQNDQMFYHLCVWRLQFTELESPYGFVLLSDTHLSHSVHHWPGNSKDAELTVQALALDICLIMDIISKLTLRNMNSVLASQNGFSHRSTQGTFCQFLLGYSCFTVLGLFLLYNKVDQLYICIYSLFWGFPSHLGHHRALSRVSCYPVCSHQLSILCIVSIVYICQSQSVNSSHPPFPLGTGNHTFVLYIYDTMHFNHFFA